MNKTISKIFIALILAISIVSIVSAGPTPHKDITFNFKLEDPKLDDGNWRMYFISVAEFTQDDTGNNRWNFTKHYDNLETNYKIRKYACGYDGTFYQVLYKMTPEEAEHKGCVVNGTYQEVYCYKTVTDNKNCNYLIPDKIDNDKLSFNTYYNSYLWDIGKADFYHHHSVYYCDINNSSCNITINALNYPYNPYVVILEKLNTSRDTYFSDEINIPAAVLFYKTKMFECPNSTNTAMDDVCDVHVNVGLTVDNLNMTTAGKLKIAFNDKWTIDTVVPADEDPFRPVDNNSTDNTDSNSKVKLIIAFIVLFIISLGVSIFAVNKMKYKTLQKIVKGKNKLQKQMIVRTYFAIIVPIMTLALFGILIWILSQLLRP